MLQIIHNNKLITFGLIVVATGAASKMKIIEEFVKKHTFSFQALTSWPKKIIAWPMSKIDIKTTLVNAVLCSFTNFISSWLGTTNNCSYMITIKK